MSLSYQKYGFEIRDLEKTYSGSRVKKAPDSRIPNTATVSNKSLQGQLYCIALCMAWHLPKSILYKSQDGCGSEVREDEETAVQVRPEVGAPQPGEQ